jgi:hypothetical protein
VDEREGKANLRYMQAEMVLCISDSKKGTGKTKTTKADLNFLKD